MLYSLCYAPRASSGNLKLTVDKNEPEPEEAVRVVAKQDVGIPVDVGLQLLEGEGEVGRRRHRVGGDVERDDADVWNRRIDRRRLFVSAVKQEFCSLSNQSTHAHFLLVPTHGSYSCVCLTAGAARIFQ